jgi:hypothetical protein
MKHIEPDNSVKPWTFLKIKEPEYRALVTVRELLATGRMKHLDIPDAGGYLLDDNYVGGNVKEIGAFNMKLWNCGTAQCIGGACELLMGKHVEEHVFSVSLYPLFYPWQVRDWNDITADKAVRAIDNFLMTGEPKWDEIMPQEEMRSDYRDYPPNMDRFEHACCE